jgi:hypothetical protein
VLESAGGELLDDLAIRRHRFHYSPGHREVAKEADVATGLGVRSNDECEPAGPQHAGQFTRAGRTIGHVMHHECQPCRVAALAG